MLFPAPTQSRPAPPLRVVVTGVGVVTAFGAGWKANARALRTGQSAIRPVTLFDVSLHRCKIAAEAGPLPNLPPNGLTCREVGRLNRASRLLLLAAYEALVQTGWKRPARLPVILGTTSGEACLGQEYLLQALQTPGHFKGQASRVAHYLIQQQGATLCGALGIDATVTTISNACASGANAIGLAWEMLRHGRASRVLAGGYEALSHLTFAGFDSLQALSPAPCRPFAASRDGLSLGEGAAILALETLDSARSRSAEILGEIIGYGASTDNHHLTQPHPEGRAAVKAMADACASAGVTPAGIDYVNAHGTATVHNDAAEAAAINAWAGRRAATLPVSSIKAGLGHSLGAAGAIGAATCLMALRGQWLPPQASHQATDAACQFQIVRQPTEAKINTALVNAFGFGGANAALILRRWP